MPDSAWPGPMVEDCAILILGNHTSYSLKQKLAGYGCDVQLSTGLKSLHLETQEEHYFDLIVLDLDHLSEDGALIGQKLKTEPELNGIPIVLLSTDQHIYQTIRDLNMQVPVYCLFKDAFLDVRLIRLIEEINHVFYRYF